MKIAILTQPVYSNYGGILQNYALQTVLERQGHSVTTLNNPVKPGVYESQLRRELSTCRRALRKLCGDPSIIWADPQRQSQEEYYGATHQNAFIQKYLHVSDNDYPIMKGQISNTEYDAFVVGSDQVWRPRYNCNLGNMFLDFTEGMNVKRIAYGASFGTDEWEMGQEQTAECSRLAKQFDAISVRETSGVELCKEHLGVDATHVLDPTMLLDAKDYLSLCPGNLHPYGEYIAVYCLDLTKEKLAIINRIGVERDLPIYLVGRFTKNGYPSIENWLEGIAHARYVITDSFHGTVFSIIFKSHFLTLSNPVRGDERFRSLFKALRIPNRSCTTIEEALEILSNGLNFYEVDIDLNRMREQSTEFLWNSLAI